MGLRFIILMTLSASLYAMESDPSRVLTIELDGIVTHQDNVSPMDFMGLTSSIPWWSVPKLLKNVTNLSNEFYEIEQKIHGTANVFMALAQRIKANYQIDIDECAPKLVKAFAKPRINLKVVQELKRLKEKSGYLILAATHYDYEHFRAYFEKIDAQKEANFNELFDGYITACFNHLPDQQESVVAPYICPMPGKKIYMACDAGAIAPKAKDALHPLKTAKYFDITRSAVQDIAGLQANCIHIDPCEQCAQVACQQPNFTSVCYDSSKGLEEQLMELAKNR